MSSRRRGSRTPAVTIYDVARAAGVATSTVSRAFSRPGRVSAATAERIHRIAEELGYRTNAFARALPMGRTGMLALIVTDVTNPVYAPIMRGAGESATEADYTLLLSDTQESADTERAALERALRVVEGIVMASSRQSDSTLRKVASQRPVVVLNRGVAGVPSVVPDNPRGMRRVAEHLGELGHDAITYVAGPEASWADGMRWRGIQEAGHELDLQIRRIGPYPPTVRGGEDACEELLDRPVTAVAAYNDLLAIGVLRGLAQRGVAVPQEVSVVGFDNIFGSGFGLPALTTVAAPLLAMGRAGVALLLERLQESPPSAIAPASPRAAAPAALPVRLVVRGSTAQRSR